MWSGGTDYRCAVVGRRGAWPTPEAKPIQVGDLLTTSARAGHAMRPSDRGASFGAVIGKALTPLAGGTGLVLVLVGWGDPACLSSGAP